MEIRGENDRYSLNNFFKIGEKNKMSNNTQINEILINLVGQKIPTHFCVVLSDEGLRDFVVSSLIEMFPDSGVMGFDKTYSGSRRSKCLSHIGRI